MSEITFSEFYESLVKLVKSFEQKNILLKLHPDLEANIIRIYGEKTDSIRLAKVGLEEISELAYSTTELQASCNLVDKS